MSSPSGFSAGTLWAKQIMWKAKEGDWLIIDHADRFKFQSRLVATGAIEIGRMMASPVPPFRSLFKCGPRLLDER